MWNLQGCSGTTFIEFMDLLTMFYAPIGNQCNGITLSEARCTQIKLHFWLGVSIKTNYIQEIMMGAES